jgi:hypothetical protein
MFALGTTLDLCTAIRIINSLRLRLHAADVLPSLRKGCTPIAPARE